MHSSLRSRVPSLRIQPFNHPSFFNGQLTPRTQQQHQQQQRQLASSSMSALLYGDTFFLDNFAVRQWDDPNYSGTRIQYDKAEFVEKVHQLFKEQGAKLVDGYAPFCKHVFVPNFVGAKVGALAITPENRHLLRCAYTRRRPEELAVLTRWFPESAVQPVPQAQHLDIILYSRQQLLQEYAAMPSKTGGQAADPEQLLPDVPWGIISIKAQDEPYETPMQPITMMRNALGREEGGSGVTLDRQAYEASTQYWQGHAAIVAGEEPSGE
uniref:Flagellar associated protein n=1 Tax=Tetradesmus obliquus TaxID=3088 RepID=A0A383V540_TETOB|eukprot:jgi/Sobl393_1/12343/SZX59902.1